MNENRKKLDAEDGRSPAERRRVAKVVHDDRGNASVEWRAAAEGQERPVLELLGEDGLALKSDEVSYDPYARARPTQARQTRGGKRTDLRKLSEWIKQMRELEDRKRTEPDPGEE